MGNEGRNWISNSYKHRHMGWYDNLRNYRSVATYSKAPGLRRGLSFY